MCVVLHNSHFGMELKIEKGVIPESKEWCGDFSGGPVVKNLLCNTRGAGSTLGPGTKIPHAVGQLILHTTTAEPVCSNEISCMM